MRQEVPPQRFPWLAVAQHATLWHGERMPDDALTPAEADELITATEAGVILGVSGSTVRRLGEAEPPRLRLVRKLPGPNGANLYRRGDVVALKAGLDAEKAGAVV